MGLFSKNIKPNAPWSKYYEEGDMNLNIPNTSVYNYFEENAEKYIKKPCLDYYGNIIQYNNFLKMIDTCAKSYYNSGIRKGDIITICVPNTIEGIIAFLAANEIGAVANFIHPSSSENEIKNSLNETNSKILIVIDINFIKVKNIINETSVHKVVLVNLLAYMSFFAKIRNSTKNRVKYKIPKHSIYIWWDDYILRAEKLELNNYIIKGKKNDPAMILQSGGTTGSSKGVVLSNSNLIAYIKISMNAQKNLVSDDVILAIMPIFHSFGMIFSVIYPLCVGMFVVLRSKFTAKDYCKMIKKYRPQVLAGVPTLFEAVLKEWNSPNYKLDFIKSVCAAGDALNPNLRNRINEFLKEHDCDCKVLEGYGLTEAVGGVVQGIKVERPNTTGVPFPGVYVGIFSEKEEQLYNEEGEICVCGPTVMLGYYNNEEETKLVLKKHKDGNIWLHTGDIGKMDEDGFVTYITRKKRMIVSSGYNIYPKRIEELLEKHPAVKKCIVIGIAHKRKIEVPKAFVILNEGFDKTQFSILEFNKICMKNLPKYSWPSEYEIIDKFPTTKLGKVDFVKLKKDSEMTKKNEKLHD